jgi:hypothetical protein
LLSWSFFSCHENTQAISARLIDFRGLYPGNCGNQ